jgi:TonB-dependent SusC/RagA subfamily outer membrane receptor
MLTRHPVRVFGASVSLLGLIGCLHEPSRPTRPRPLADVVDVGYGNQPRANVTGAIVSVSGEQIERQNAMAVADLLERVPGVQVTRRGQTFTVRVRFAGGEPLYVVDGKPLLAAGGGALADLLPSDIERIDVLKDGAAASAYGSRGGNGVVLITTRRLR